MKRHMKPSLKPAGQAAGQLAPFPAAVPIERRKTGAAVTRLELASDYRRGNTAAGRRKPVSQGFVLYPSKLTHFFFSGCRIGILQLILP